MNNKYLNFLKEFTLKELCEYFENKKVLVEVTVRGSVLVEYAEIQIDEDCENDVGFFDGRNCEYSLCSSDVLKLIDFDTLKVINSKHPTNVGAILKFFVVSGHSFV